MKKIKRLGRKSISVLLSLLMVISTMLVGMANISAATDTLYVTGDAADGWGSWRELDQKSADNSIAYTTITRGSEFKVSITNDYDQYTGISLNNSLGDVYINGSLGSGNLSTAGTGTAYLCVVLSSGNVYASTTEPSSGGTTETTYYLGGRIKQDGSETWLSKDNTQYPFSATDTDGLYKIETNQTEAQWSETRGNNLPQYFYIHQGANKTWYGTNNETVLSSPNQRISLQDLSYNTDTDVTYLTYIKGTSTEGNVTIWLDTRDGMQMYYTIAGSATEPTEPETAGVYKIKDKSNNDAVTAAAKADGKTANTADENDVVTVTVTPTDSWYKVAGLKATYTTADDVDQELEVTGDNGTYTFTMPAADVEIEASYTVDKQAYIEAQGDGLWVDVNPDATDSVSTLIKWNNYSGNSHQTDDTYTFYLPKNTDLANARVYNGFDNSVNVAGYSVQPNSASYVNLKEGDNSCSAPGIGTVRVMVGSTDAMFLYTTDGKGNAQNLPTKVDQSLADKDSVKTKGGDCVTMDNSAEAADFSEAMLLEQVKGRGNSSWEASSKIFGKYAFNMKLAGKTNLLGMDASESKGAKSWCLLANNADESMLRNALTFDLADALGLPYSPEYRFVDIYDNGEYMGQYLVTEKVDVGTSKLVKGESFDDINEKAAEANVDEEIIEDSNQGKYTFNGQTYDMKYATVLDDGNTSEISVTNATYLLEFEIGHVEYGKNQSRYDAEASGFVSPQGQHVVVKSPEFATKEQVEYIAQKYAEMEAVAFSSDISTLGNYMDTESFALMYLIQELSSNLDSAATSYYIMYSADDTANKEIEPNKFVASPVWDYDWAYGQYEKQTKLSVSGSHLNPANPQAWFAKDRAYDDAQDPNDRKYSLQSKLANNADFQAIIKKAWQTNFYDKIQTYYAENGKLDTWYNEIKDSVAMNEARWGIIENRNNMYGTMYGESGWGSKDTGSTHEAAVNYLKNTWLSTRANWLNTEIGKWASYEIAKPVISATDTAGEPLPSTIEEGTPFKITATSTDDFVSFELYDNGEKVANAVYENGAFTVSNAAAGEHSYTVKAVFGNLTVESDSINITVTEKTTEFTVTLDASSDTVTTGDKFTLTAHVTPDTVGTCTYEYFSCSDASGANPTSLGAASAATTKSITTDAEGTYYYFVQVTCGEVTNKSNVVQVVVNDPVAGEHEVTVYFKAPSTSVYKPSVSLNGATSVAMTKDTYLGADYMGLLKMYWYKATFTVDSTSDNTLTFTTKSTDLNATYTSTLSNSTYYIAADDLVNGETVVDLSGAEEYIRNFYYSPLHMVYNVEVPTDATLGFTNVGGTRYRMGSYINSRGEVQAMNIKSATEAQKVTAGCSDASSLQKNLIDVNLDGKVDITDATLMQKALVS